MKAIRFERFILAGVLALAVGCNEDTDDGGAGDTLGGGDDGPMCQNCNSCPNDLWACTCEVAPGQFEERGCAGCYPGLLGEATADADCEAACDLLSLPHMPVNESELVCENFGLDETGEGLGDPCSSWDPGSEVTLINRVWHMDKAFVDSIVDGSLSNPSSPLVACDSARVEVHASGTVFKITNAATTDLLYKLGLRNNDIPLDINNMPLTSYHEALAAFAQLYMSGETEYALKVQRGSNMITLDYELD